MGVGLSRFLLKQLLLLRLLGCSAHHRAHHLRPRVRLCSAQGIRRRAVPIESLQKREKNDFFDMWEKGVCDICEKRSLSENSKIRRITF